MQYTSFLYLSLLLLVFIVYYILPVKYRWTALLIGNLIFYAASGLKQMVIMIISSFAVWLITGKIGRLGLEQKELRSLDLSNEEKKEKTKAVQKKKKNYLYIGLVLLVGTLFVTKYTNFVLKIAGRIVRSQSIPFVQLIVPLGISFYTFIMDSYLVDVYKGKCEAQNNYFRFLTFACFFPAVVQGPISRYSQLAPQLYEGHKFNIRNFRDGAILILWGFAKKLVLAEEIGIFVNQIFDHSSQYRGMIFLLAAAAYSIQTYADFSGCMDIGLGAARIFGIELTRNFLRPYFSKSIPEFWRRWHVTLGTWFKDYVFFPYSISKTAGAVNKTVRDRFGKTAGRTVSVALPLLLVWFLTGLWHGAEMKYIVWGLYHGTLIILGAVFGERLAVLTEKLHIRTDCFSFRFFQMARTFFLCCIGRIFFRAAGLRNALSILYRMCTGKGIGSWPVWEVTQYTRSDIWNFAVIVLLLAAWLIVSIMQEKGKDVLKCLDEQNLIFRWGLLYLLLFTVLLAGHYGPGFNTSAFIYEQF